MDRHIKLTEDPDVKRWYGSFDSQKTAKDRLRQLGLFCERMETTPKGYVRLSAKVYTDMLQDYCVKWPGGTVKKAVVSWLTHWGKTLQRKVKVKIVNHRDQHVPPREDIRKVLDAGNVRARAAIAVMAFSGQRPEVLASGENKNPDGTPAPDGLRLGDIVDLEIADGGKGFRFTKVPARFNVRAVLSKASRPGNPKPYFSFLGRQAIGLLTTYWNLRMQQGETLTPTSLVIGRTRAITQKGDNGGKVVVVISKGDLPLSSGKFSEIIRPVMRLVGIAEAPYIWRSFFSTFAEMCRDLPKDYREFCMGHGLNDISKVYSLNKGLPPEKVEDIRQAFAKAMPFVETTEPDTTVRVADLEKKYADLIREKPNVMTAADLRQRADLQAELVVAQTATMSDGEIAARAEVDRLQQIIADQMNDDGELLVVEKVAPARAARKVVAQDEAEVLALDGWNVVSQIGAKYVMEREA
jgi:hypothetical protein